MKCREFLKRLRRYGAKIIESEGKGSHVMIYFGERRVSTPFHASVDYDPRFFKSICKQLGIDPTEIL
jgi:predicted RNA binding protein YcfA (HicA-like mRNA interferase family)